MADTVTTTTPTSVSVPDSPYNTWDDLNRASAYAKTQPAWLRASARLTLLDAIPVINAARVAAYRAAFADYRANRDTRPDVTPGPAPEPAFAMIVTTDQYGNPVEGVGTERVCPTQPYVPPVKADLAKGKVGNFVYTDPETGLDWFMWLPGDITLPGQMVHTVSADGVEGLFVKQRALQGSGAGVTAQVNGYYIRKG